MLVKKILIIKNIIQIKKLSLDTIEDYITIAKIFSMTKNQLKKNGKN